MRPFSFCIVALAAFGCAPSSQYMRVVESPSPLKPDGEHALVVFVRPSSYAWGVGANVLDENGRFLGDALASGWFAVALPPGHHEFTVWAENTDGLAADLAPGRTYYVEVAATMGGLSAQMHFRAIKPSRPNWSHRDEWMSKTKQYLSDFAAGQANLDKRHDDVAERLRRAREHLAKYSGDALSEHTLGPDDGVSG